MVEGNVLLSDENILCHMGGSEVRWDGGNP